VVTCKASFQSNQSIICARGNFANRVLFFFGGGGGGGGGVEVF
jgi:hypothetical protein